MAAKRPRLLKPLPSTGFSLIELLLVLGVIAILLVSAFVIYPQVSHANKVKTETANLAAIQASMRSLFASSGSNYALLPPEVSTATLNNARVFPASMNGGDYTTGAIRHSWDGLVSLHATNFSHAGIPVGRGFSINYMDMPSQACVDMVSRSFKTFKIIMVYANGSSNSADMFYPEATDLSTLTQACNQSNAVRIQFLSN